MLRVFLSDPVEVFACYHIKLECVGDRSSSFRDRFPVFEITGRDLEFRNLALFEGSDLKGASRMLALYEP